MFSRKRSARVQQPCIVSGSGAAPLSGAASALLASRYVGRFLRHALISWIVEPVWPGPIRLASVKSLSHSDAIVADLEAGSALALLARPLASRSCFNPSAPYGSAPTQISTSPLSAFARPARGRSILPLIYAPSSPVDEKAGGAFHECLRRS
jgi:hypothetical protein